MSVDRFLKTDAAWILRIGAADGALCPVSRRQIDAVIALPPPSPAALC